MDLRRVGVIGLGLMGTALGERLLRAGDALRVWNRTPDKARPLGALGGAWSDNPLGECDRVLLCLSTSDVVEAVLARPGDKLRRGQILLDTTTGEPPQMVALGVRLAARVGMFGEGVSFPFAALTFSLKLHEAGAALG